MTEAGPQPAQPGRATLYAWLAGFLMLAAVAIPAGVVLGIFQSFQKIEELEAPTPKDLGMNPQMVMLSLAVGAFLGLSGVALLLLLMTERSRGDFSSPRVS